MTPPASAAPGRIDAGPVLAEAAGAFARHLRLLPALAWPALTVTLLVLLARSFVLPADGAWAAVTLLKLPFDLMLATAWARLLLLGPSRVRLPALGWRRAESDFLFQLVVFALAFAGGLVLTVLIVGNLPLGERPQTIAVAAAGWLILTMLTPLALKLPARACGADLPGRAWQARLANFPNAALVWLVFLTLSLALKLIPVQVPADPGPLAAAAAALLDAGVDYLLLLGFLAVTAAMLRRLAGWAEPA